MPVLYRRAQGACTSILDEFTAARNPELTTPVGPPLTRSSAFYLVWDTRHLSVLPRKVGVALSTLALRAGQTAMITVPDLASSRKEPRSEPLARAAVPCTPYPPAYVAQLRKAWRV